MSVVDPSGISSSTQNVPAAFSLLNNPLSRGGRSVKLAFQSVNLLFTHKGSRQATFESIDPLRRKVQGLVGEPTNYGLGQVAGDSVQSGFEFARHCKWDWEVVCSTWDEFNVAVHSPLHPSTFYIVETILTLENLCTNLNSVAKSRPQLPFAEGSIWSGRHRFGVAIACCLERIRNGRFAAKYQMKSRKRKHRGIAVNTIPLEAGRGA